MTVLLEYTEVVNDNTKEVKRVVYDVPHITITERGGSRVLVTPKGETIAHVDTLDDDYRIVGEVRFA